MPEVKRDPKPTIRVSQATFDALKQLLEDKDVTMTEMAEQVIGAGLMAMSVGQGLPSTDGVGILSDAALDRIRAHAKKHNTTETDAADRLTEVGVNRLAALEKDRAKHISKKGVK